MSPIWSRVRRSSSGVNASLEFRWAAATDGIAERVPVVSEAELTELSRSCRYREARPLSGAEDGCGCRFGRAAKLRARQHAAETLGNLGGGAAEVDVPEADEVALDQGGLVDVRVDGGVQQGAFSGTGQGVLGALLAAQVGMACLFPPSTEPDFPSRSELHLKDFVSCRGQGMACLLLLAGLG